MADSTINETEFLPKKPEKRSSLPINVPDPSRPIRFLMSRRREVRGNSNVGFVHEMETINEPTSPEPSPTGYGYLAHIQSFKPLLTSEDKSLPKKVRKYYAEQLELIDGIEDILLPKDAKVKDSETAKREKHKRIIKILTTVTLITNIVLVIIKIAGAVISKSLSVISSVVDSVVDLLTSVILIWTARKIKNRDIYKYPGGRTRLEPIAVVILSVIMCSASVQVIYESAETLVDDVEYFEHKPNASSPHTLHDIDMSIVPIIAMVLTIVSKAILFFLCYPIKNPTMSALAEDNRNDVASNIVALACGLVASYALKGKINQKAIVVDEAGAILISVYIIIAWIFQANRQIRHLSGLSAEPSYLQQLTHVVYNYRPDVVTKIDTVQAIHLGTDLLVEVGIGLPGPTPLAEAHDVGAGLQKSIEGLKDVERAFVHLDFGYERTSICEHKEI